MLTSNSRHGKSFREAGSRIFQQESEVDSGIINLLAARTPTAVRELPLEKVVANPSQPRTTWHEGVRFEEVSVGYPREWRKRPGTPGTLRRILPMEVGAGDGGAAPGVGRGRGELR